MEKEMSANLSNRIGKLQAKISLVEERYENIEDPDYSWIRGSRPPRFRLNGSLMEKLQALGEIANYKSRIDERFKPAIHSKIKELEDQLPLEIEPFTNQEAALLGALIQSRNRVLVNLNGHGSFRFEVEQEVLEACQKLQQLPAKNDYQNEPNRDQIIQERRDKFIGKLHRILNAENVDDIIGSQENDDVDIVLMWLYYQNEEQFLGLLPDFLTTRPQRIQQVEKGQILSAVVMVYSPSGEILSKIRKPKEEKSLPSVELEHLINQEEDFLFPTIEEEAIFFEQSASKPKILYIEKRDPDVHSKIRGYLLEIYDKNIRQPVNADAVRKNFSRLSVVEIDTLIDKKFIRGEYKGGDPYKSFAPQEIAVMLYMHSNRKGSGGFNKRLAEEVYKIAEKEYQTILQDKENKIDYND